MYNYSVMFLLGFISSILISLGKIQVYAMNRRNLCPCRTALPCTALTKDLPPYMKLGSGQTNKYACNNVFI